ncbi:MAG: SapC family protein, partial [Gammaproteobacteria bacterium]|nr:SapC family protein [Gammaproteobacteria bacterium]
MADFALLNNVDHQDLRVITERSWRAGDNARRAVTFPFEFRNVQAHYPILFQNDAGGGYYPVALFGFEQGENLFLDDNGWHAGYIPAMIQREPFLIGYQESTDDAVGERTRVLSLDMDHPRVNTKMGEPLFQPLGGRTPFLENAANLLETIYLGIEHNKAFVAALQEHDLLEALTFEIALQDGTRNQLIGFHCLVEEKVQALSGAALGQFNDKG